MKRKCAKEAAKWIKDGMILGMGGGSTVGFLLEELANAKKSVQVVTPSQSTEELCWKYHIPVLPLERVDTIDLAFDGCDEVDFQLNAIKSCGGIHTREKLVADMAQEYILLAEEGKYHETLEFHYPVTVEVLPCARGYVKKCLETLGGTVSERYCDNKTGLTITDDGNYLMEAHFPSKMNLEKLDRELNGISGLVGHGLFYQKATCAMIAGKESIQIVRKSQ